MLSASIFPDRSGVNATKASPVTGIKNAKGRVTRTAKKENAPMDQTINAFVILDGQALIAALVVVVTAIHLVTSKVQASATNVKNTLMENFVNYARTEVMATQQVKWDARSAFVMGMRTSPRASVIAHLETVTALITLKVIR